MPVEPPTDEDVARIARRYHLDLSGNEIAAYRALVAGAVRAYARLEQMPEPPLPVKYPRDGGRAPAPGENPLNAWAWRVDVPGADAGPLAGKRVVVKENTCVAGVPLRAGSRVLGDGFVPDVDATVVTRLLDAGARLTGTATCEDLAFSGGSHTSATGPVRNPHDPARMAGGSSSGSAVLVATGEVDAAIGSSQGGSILVPSAWCGVVGLKPTHGLVPYTGILPVDVTLDDAGPIAPSVPDAARLLDALAGPDGLDPWHGDARAASSYVDALSEDVRGLRVGLLREGFGHDASDPDVDHLVAEETRRRFTDAGAEVVDASVPAHADALVLLSAIANEGALDLLVNGHGLGTNREGHYLTGLADALEDGWAAHARDVSPTLKLTVLTGAWARERGHGRYYAKAQNARRALRAAYVDALRGCDVLVMPTTPYKAPPFPAADAGVDAIVAAGTSMLANACALDVTGSPGVNVPAGESEGLPVGATLMGRPSDERTLLHAAYAFEARA